MFDLGLHPATPVTAHLLEPPSVLPQLDEGITTQTPTSPGGTSRAETPSFTESRMPGVLEATLAFPMHMPSRMAVMLAA